MTDHIFISIVIPTYNRAQLLERTLQSILQQQLKGKSYEVIVFDNGSTDHTKSVVEQFMKSHDYMSYVFDNRPGLHVGRNRGLELVKGEIITYVDDDIIVFNNWLETIKHVFENNPAVGIVGGNNYPDYEIAPPKLD